MDIPLYRSTDCICSQEGVQVCIIWAALKFSLRVRALDKGISAANLACPGIDCEISRSSAAVYRQDDIFGQACLVIPQSPLAE